ncbi:MAG: aldehyde ferredoxin oxidoreductase C-terminal domain-containing protein, partial [Methanothrix sp.]
NIIDSLGAVGIVKSRDELQELGKRIFEEKYKFKTQEGFDLSAQRIPRRFYETVSASGMVTAETVQEMLRIYRKKRGWG